MTSGAPQCIEEEDSRNEAVNIKSEAELESYSSDNESWYEKEDANTFFVKQETNLLTLREDEVNQSSFSHATHQKKNKTVKVKVKVKERKTESNLSFSSTSFLTTTATTSDSESDEHDHDLFTPTSSSTSSSTSKRRRPHRTKSSSAIHTIPKTIPKTKRKQSRLNPWKPFELELNVGEKRPSPLRIGFGFGFGFGFGPCHSLASFNSGNSVNSVNSVNSWPRETSQVKAAWTRTRLVVARTLKSQNDPQLERVDASLTQTQSQKKETLVVITRKNEQKAALEVGETDPFNELTQVGPTYTWKILKHRDALERVVDYDQVVKVIQGELEVRFRRNAKGYMIAGEGDCVFLPAHVLYTLINASSHPTEFEYFSTVRTTFN
ncbi:hypothetical protein BCR33DRAFT_854585 [Rhizoclosmatium globosum]|uniref:Uncharacterized protein n=1 Tax=Rhizoclosmatium globosum TaxID=329046 RepID=A0A1Y2BS38_9FUNG|nr:hypothetical protein BCR33DRAFT_854585 [Rhizoclosmatium globosum]|eukprot:ORY37572.1 hypothetical protein BCR33DRAFT_854585 [Rhizoclosmatium globosum]